MFIKIIDVISVSTKRKMTIKRIGDCELVAQLPIIYMVMNIRTAQFE